MREQTPFPAPQKSEVKRQELSHIEHQDDVERRRHETLLVCPANDAESYTILALAEKAGIRTIRSDQKHGAVLNREYNILNHISAAKLPNVWIVEMPGPELEQELRDRGLAVLVIDHHQYKDLDRLTDQESGGRKTNSLEQFLHAAGITDEELTSWGYDPKTVHGLGVMDDRFVQGLRDDDYTQEEIIRVLEASDAIARRTNPYFQEIKDAADKDWEKRTMFGMYTLVQSSYPKDIRGAIAHLSIREGLDTKPLIISSCDEEKIFVQNVSPNMTSYLMKVIPGKTFIFGDGSCWGVDSRKQAVKPRLQDVLDAIQKAPEQKETF